jgi:ketosteroid isomerase-like protein
MNTEINKEEVKTVINQFFHAMDTQNMDLMKNVIAHDEEMAHIGTESDERWDGWSVLEQATQEQFENLQSYDVSIRDQMIHLSESGTVAWFAHTQDATIISGGSTTEMTEARMTGVLEKRNHEWKITQTHLSIPEDIQ